LKKQTKSEGVEEYDAMMRKQYVDSFQLLDKRVDELLHIFNRVYYNAHIIYYFKFINCFLVYFRYIRIKSKQSNKLFSLITYISFILIETHIFSYSHPHLFIFLSY